MPEVVTEKKSLPAAAPQPGADPGASSARSSTAPVFALSDVWAGLKLPGLSAAVSTPEKAGPEQNIESAKGAVTLQPRESEPSAGREIKKDPSFFWGHSALGLKATIAAAVVGAGYLFSMASPAALFAGGLIWWGIEGAVRPFFDTKSTNPVNFGYYVIEKSSQGLTSLGRSTLRGLSGSGGQPTALETVTFGANALGVRSVVALASYVVGWSGAFGIASPFLCGLAGALMYRGIEMAARSFSKPETKEKK